MASNNSNVDDFLYFVKRKKCPVCFGNKQTDVVVLSYGDEKMVGFLKSYYRLEKVPEEFTRVDYRLRQCHVCGFVFQELIPNQKLIRLLYNKWIDSSASFAKKNHNNTKLFFSYVKQLSLMHSLVSEKSAPIRVLDYGMGWGYWGRVAQSLGFEVTGLEIAKDRLAFAKKFGYEVVSKLPQTQNHYSMINLEQVLEHVDKPREILQKLVDLTTKNGVIHIAVPDGSNLIGQVKSDHWKPGKDAAHPLEHINTFTSESLDFLAASVGLKKVTPLLVFEKQKLAPAHGWPQYMVELVSFTWQTNGTDKYYFKP